MSDIASTPTTTPCTPEPYPCETESYLLTPVSSPCQDEPFVSDVEIVVPRQCSPRPMPINVGEKIICLCKTCYISNCHKMIKEAYDIYHNANSPTLFAENYQDSPSWYKLLVEIEKKAQKCKGSYDENDFPEGIIEDQDLLDILEGKSYQELSLLEIPNFIGDDCKMRYSILLNREEELLKLLPGWVRLYPEFLHNAGLIILVHSLNNSLADLLNHILREGFSSPNDWLFDQATIVAPYFGDFSYTKGDKLRRQVAFKDYFSMISICSREEVPNFAFPSHLPREAQTCQGFFLNSKLHSEYQDMVFTKELYQLEKTRFLFKNIGFDWLTRLDLNCNDISEIIGPATPFSGHKGYPVDFCIFQFCPHYCTDEMALEQLKEFKTSPRIKKYRLFSTHEVGKSITCDECVFGETAKNDQNITSRYFSWQANNLPSPFPHEFHDQKGCKERDFAYLMDLLHGKRFARCKRARPQEWKNEPEEEASPLKIYKNY